MSESDANAMIEELKQISALLRQSLDSQGNRPPRLLRIDAASKYVGIGQAKLRALAQSGELPIIRLDDSGHSPWLFDVRDLDHWIERSKTNF